MVDLVRHKGMTMQRLLGNRKNLKLKYAPPKIIYYGRVATLTRSGTSGSNEQSQGLPPGTFRAQSDRRLKEKIVKVGTHPLNVGLYWFYYKDEFKETLGSDRQFGVMADEVEKVMPKAVSVNQNGYKIVDYEMLGIHRS